MTRRILPLCIALLAACGDRPMTPASDTLLAVNGTRLYVHREGAGEPMIVIHGGPLLDHGYLLEPLRPLGDELDLVFYDQRLSGRSAGVVDSASVRLATFAEDVEAIRDALGLDRIHLFGHSWGGLIAMEYAIRHPDRLRSLLLINPMPPTAALWQEGERAQAAALEPADTAGMGALRASPGIAAAEPAAVADLLRLSFRSQFHEPELAGSLDFHIEPDYGARSRQFGLLVPDLGTYDVRTRLREVRVPVLIVHGAAEIGVQPGIAALRADLPHARVEAIDATGHFPFIEEPARFLRIVRDFLAAL